MTINPDQVWDQASGGTFITADEKAMIHAKQAPIYVYDAEPRTESQWGDDQTIFHVRSNDKQQGDMRLLAFSHSAHRERLASFSKVALAASTPGDCVGPFYLHKFPTNTGHAAWVLKNTPQIGEPESVRTATPPAPAATPAPAAAPIPATASDDDLPF